jgi:hypothetical protein
MEENQNSAVESMEFDIPSVNFNETELFLFNRLYK